MPGDESMNDLQMLLEQFGLGEQFIVIQEDAMLLECVECGERVTADVVDLHGCSR